MTTKTNIISDLFEAQTFYDGLIEHRDVIVACFEELLPALEANLAGDLDKVKEHAEKIFRLEQRADKLERAFRDRIGDLKPMRFDRGDILAYLGEQDKLGDKVEDIAMLLRLARLDLPEECVDGGKHSCEELLRDLAERSVRAARKATEMTVSLFEEYRSRPDAEGMEALRKIVKKIGKLEHKTDKHQYKLVSTLLSPEQDELPFPRRYVALRVVRNFARLADHAEAMGDLLRMMLA